MRKLQAKWSLEPGDGSGNSIADAHARNEKGLCAVLGCGKPMNPEYKWFFGCLCDECNKKYQDA